MILDHGRSLHPSMMPEDTKPAATNEITKSNNVDSNRYEVLTESFARITLAGFIGSLNGLALEKQQQKQQIGRQQHPHLDDAVTSKLFQREKKEAPSLSHRNIRRHPPKSQSMLLQRQQANYNNLPMTWALSCMVFVALLETCRVNSPTSKLLDTVFPSSLGYSFDDQVHRTAIVSISDYTIGGTIAGLAGSLARRNSPAPRAASNSATLQLPQTILQTRRRPLLIWGLGTGMCLGIVAGVCQALVDVGSLYLYRDQTQPPEVINPGEENRNNGGQ